MPRLQAGRRATGRPDRQRDEPRTPARTRLPGIRRVSDSVARRPRAGTRRIPSELCKLVGWFSGLSSGGFAGSGCRRSMSSGQGAGRPWSSQKPVSVPCVARAAALSLARSAGAGDGEVAGYIAHAASFGRGGAVVRFGVGLFDDGGSRIEVRVGEVGPSARRVGMFAPRALGRCAAFKDPDRNASCAGPCGDHRPRG